MINHIHVEIVKGGFILEFLQAGTFGEPHSVREVLPTRRKLQHRISELLKMVEAPGSGAGQ
jgi:hypothetical protein